MDYGAHLPLIGFNGSRFNLEHLLAYAERAERLGFQALAVNDHMVFPRPWLDGPMALAAVLTRTGRMTLQTTVALPVVRGPVPLAKAMAALDLLSEGRLVIGVGPGSSVRDFNAIGVPFDERWPRLDEAVQALRSLLYREARAFKGRFYSTEGITLEPHSAQQPGPPIWIGSWGSEVGLRRTARLGDGWLASAYNTTPEVFAVAWARLLEHLEHEGKDPGRFPNAIATMLLFVTEDKGEAERVIRQTVSPTLNRPEDELHQRLLIGSAEDCAQKLMAYQAAGVNRVFLWPVAEELAQLTLFQERVAPSVK